MEFHRGRVNQKFVGVYKRGDGERNGTERCGTRRKYASGTETEERFATVSFSAYASSRVPISFSQQYRRENGSECIEKKGGGCREKVANSDDNTSITYVHPKCISDDCISNGRQIKKFYLCSFFEIRKKYYFIKDELFQVYFYNKFRNL